MTFIKKNFFISGQLALVLILIFGMNSIAHTKRQTDIGSYQQTKRQTKKKFKPSYKVENCDCLGFSEDIPTFLSDLANSPDLNIYGEGKSIKAAQKEAQNMCVETYRNYASVSTSEHPNSVTQSGCQKFRSTAAGDWVAI